MEALHFVRASPNDRLPACTDGLNNLELAPTSPYGRVRVAATRYGLAWGLTPIRHRDVLRAKENVGAQLRAVSHTTTLHVLDHFPNLGPPRLSNRFEFFFDRRDR